MLQLALAQQDTDTHRHVRRIHNLLLVLAVAICITKAVKITLIVLVTKHAGSAVNVIVRVAHNG